jgi:potassium efflux system protein
MHKFLRLFLLAAVTLVSIGGAARSQSVPSLSAKASTTPIPLGEVASQSESAAATIREIEANLEPDKISAAVDRELPLLTSEVEALRADSSSIVTSNPSLDLLSTLERTGQAFLENLGSWNRDLARRATELNAELGRLDQLENTWQQTLKLAQSSNPPPELVESIQSVIAEASQTRAGIERQRGQVLGQQNRVAQEDGRVTSALASVQRARRGVLNRLLSRDSPPIWRGGASPRAGHNLTQDSRTLLSDQITALHVYFRRQTAMFFVHLVIIVLLLIALYAARSRFRKSVEEEPGHERAGSILDVPIATAITLSFALTAGIYTQAPRLLRVFLGVGALIPATIVLRRLIDRRLFPLLDALWVIYFVDQARILWGSLQVLARWLFLAEMLGVILFVLWFINSPRWSTAPEDRSSRTIRVCGRIAFVVFSAALVANALGYVNLGNLIGIAMQRGAYLATILYAGVRIGDGFIWTALQVRPFVALGMVTRHRSLLRHRASLVLRWLAILLWLANTLEVLGLRTPFLEQTKNVLSTSVTVGSINLSLGPMLAFILTVWASFLISRFLRFLLEEDFYQYFHLERGLSNAISTMLHYTILLIGFFVAVAALGFDLAKITILAGALSVGIGFGLQNIINNFVSGIILLFERPIKVGDTIQLDDAVGVVEHIGIRATIVRTADGSEIIVPNGSLISNRVTNWTFSDRQRVIAIPIGVARGTDPDHVIELLKGVAASNPLVAKIPTPQVHVTFSPGALAFEFRAYTNHSEEWPQIRSQLTLAINSVLAKENISTL